METPNTAPEQEQALAVFNHAGEEIRFFKSQQWYVTNYALLTYAALAATPSWVEAPKWGGFASWFCAGLVIVAAGWAWWVLRSLGAALEKERGRMDEARSKLPLVQEIHAKFKPRDRTVSSILQAAILAGAYLAIFINLSRIPRVAAWLTAGL